MTWNAALYTLTELESICREGQKILKSSCDVKPKKTGVFRLDVCEGSQLLLLRSAPLPFPLFPAEGGAALGGGSLMDRVQAGPYPILFQYCLPYAVPSPRSLHLPIISATTCSQISLVEQEQSVFPPLASALHTSTHNWLHKGADGWDPNQVLTGLFDEVKQGSSK
ncbi:hypothetical protein D4764_15G0013780 [Takifugu flavidus]|uniref:Uncharacterized protein n=1 Tax=Takifugu flavidus TaxID=433684 RepID=A0A5C6P2H7_9TELE|nr:hypothetical protein D4764_15G0013780 [Takifugu flavidus]